MSTFRRRRDERGASAVEFALVVPLLLTFLLGTVELGLYMKDYVSMSSSVRDTVIEFVPDVQFRR